MLPAPEAAAAFCARHLSLAAPSGGDEIRHALAALIRREREAMREACAKAIEGFRTGGPSVGTVSYWGEALAERLRALPAD